MENEAKYGFDLFFETKNTNWRISESGFVILLIKESSYYYSIWALKGGGFGYGKDTYLQIIDSKRMVKIEFRNQIQILIWRRQYEMIVRKKV